MGLSEYLDRLDQVVKRDDIRGVYGEVIDEDFAYNLGLALAEMFLECTAVSPVNVVVGHDMRISGPILAGSLAAGLADGGCRPITLGMVGTELVGFMTAKYAEVIDGGVMVTASHNPKDENGFKFFGPGGVPLPMAVGAEPMLPEADLQRLVLGAKKRGLPAQLRWADVAPDYMQTILEKSDCDFEKACAGATERMRIAVEAGNGMGAKILEEFAGRAPQFEWRFSNAVPDGNFPAVIPNPLNPEYQEMVGELVRRTGSHVGICFDGDADRVAVVDENGAMVSPGLLAALVGRRLREKRESEDKFAFNLACSWVVADTLGDRHDVLGQGKAVMTPVGYTKIKAIMHGDPSIAFGSEHSGHYMFREFWCADSGMLAGMLMLGMAAELHAQGLALSSALEGPRRRYCESGEINFRLPPGGSACRLIERAAGDFAGEIERMYVVVEDHIQAADSYPPEGLVLGATDLRAEAGAWWFCLRTGTTENLLRLYVEADGDRALMERKRDELVQMIGPEFRV